MPEKLVTDYVDHLAQITIRKEKRKAETDRQRKQRQQQEYNDIDWDNLYNTDSLSTLKVCKLDLYLQHHKMTFRGTKKQKIAIIKAHIGSKIIASISVQEAEAITAQTASDSESDFVDQSIGSFTSASSESSDLSDFSEGCNAVMEATTEASSSRYGRKRTKVQRDNFVQWAQIDF